MGALIDLVGRRFGLLTVKTRLPDRIAPSGARQPVWGCVCVCGRRTVEQGRALRSARALSCRECVRDPSRMLKYGHTYIVWWPELGVLKIGRAFRGSRLETMRRTGAIVLLDAEDTDGSWEAAGLRALRRLFDPAFTGPTGEGSHRADRILYRGRGWSECFLVEQADLQLAFDVCQRAFALEGNDFGHNPPATATWRRALDGAQRARASARGRADRARAADAGGDVADAAAPREDRGAAVPDHVDERVDGARDLARGDARGGRACTHVGRRIGGMARHAAAALRGAHGAACGSASTRPDLRPGAGIFTGWRERERKRTRESESARASTCAGGRGSAGVGDPLGNAGSSSTGALTSCTPGFAQRSAHRMSRAPQRHHGCSLRTMRHRGGISQAVARQSSLHGTARHLRGAAGDPR